MMAGLHPNQSWGMDPGFTLAAQGPGWYAIDDGAGGDAYRYGFWRIENDADSGDYEAFIPLPEPDPLANESPLVRQLATYGGMGAQYSQQYYSDPRYLQRLRGVAQYLNFAEQLAGHSVNWIGAISAAWIAQLAQFGAWSNFDDPGQTALKIIARSGLPNARELSDAIRSTRSFQEGQAAMAKAWEQSNEASNLFTMAKEIASDVAALASSGGFRIIMLPFAVTGALNLANNLAQNGLTETIRQTAQSAANTLNNALSLAQSADAATVAAEQAAQVAAEQAAQAVQTADMTGFYTPDILSAPAPSFIDSVINPASLPVNPAADLLIDFAPTANAAEWLQVTPDVDMTGFRTPDILDQPIEKPFVETVTNPADLPVNTAEDVLIDLPTESSPWTAPPVINDFGQGTIQTLTPPAATTAATTAATAATGTGAASVLTTAANAIKAGAGILALTMGTGGSTAPRPGIPLQPGQVITTGQPQPFTGAAFPWYILIPAAALLLARKG